MRNKLLSGVIAALLLAAPLPAHATKSPMPGDACTAPETGNFVTTAGSQTAPYGYFVICDGSRWNLFLGFTTAGNVGIGPASGASLTIGASGASTSKINIGPTMGAAAPNSNIGAAVVATSETRAAVGFAALTTPGPIVTMTTGTTAIVTLTANMSNPTAIGDGCQMGFAISGATVVAANTAQALWMTAVRAAADPFQMSATFYVTGLTAGSNTFTAQYSTVTGGTCTFVNRNLVVMLP